MPKGTRKLDQAGNAVCHALDVQHLKSCGATNSGMVASAENRIPPPPQQYPLLQGDRVNDTPLTLLQHSMYREYFRTGYEDSEGASEGFSICSQVLALHARSHSLFVTGEL